MKMFSKIREGISSSLNKTAEEETTQTGGVLLQDSMMEMVNGGCEQERPADTEGRVPFYAP